MGQYENLKFEPFAAEYREDWPTVPTDGCREKIMPGAVLKVRTRAPLPGGWREAARFVRPEAYRSYVEPAGEPWFDVTEERGVYTFRLPPEDGDPEVVLRLPVDRDAAGYGEAAEVVALELTRQEYGPDEEVSDWMVEDVVGRIYENDDGAPLGEPFYRLVGDVNTVLGLCDDCTDFGWSDVEAVAYLPGFEPES